MAADPDPDNEAAELKALKEQIREDLRRLQRIEKGRQNAAELSAFLGRYQKRRPKGSDRIYDWIDDPWKLSSVAYLKIQKMLQADLDDQLRKRRPPGEAPGPSSPSSQAM